VIAIKKPSGSRQASATSVAVAVISGCERPGSRRMPGCTESGRSIAGKDATLMDIDQIGTTR
jgi:hypothetical protein